MGYSGPAISHPPPTLFLLSRLLSRPLTKQWLSIIYWHHAPDRGTRSWLKPPTLRGQPPTRHCWPGITDESPCHCELQIAIMTPSDVNFGWSTHFSTSLIVLFNLTYSLPNSISIDWDPLRRWNVIFQLGHYPEVRMVPNDSVLCALWFNI